MHIKRRTKPSWTHWQWIDVRLSKFRVYSSCSDLAFKVVRLFARWHAYCSCCIALNYNSNCIYNRLPYRVHTVSVTPPDFFKLSLFVMETNRVLCEAGADIYTSIAPNIISPQCCPSLLETQNSTTVLILFLLQRCAIMHFPSPYRVRFPALYLACSLQFS